MKTLIRAPVAARLAGTLRLAITMLAIAFALSCQKAEKSSPPQAPKSLTLQEELRDEPGMLLTVPVDAYGFVTWDSTGKPYERLRRSLYSVSSIVGVPAERMLRIDHPLLDALRERGFDLQSNETYQSLFAQAVSYIAPGPSKAEPLALALRFQTAPGHAVEPFFLALRTALENRGVSVTDVGAEGLRGYSFDARALDQQNVGRRAVRKSGRSRLEQSENSKVYVAWQGKDGLVSTSLPLVSLGFARSGRELPVILTQPLFAQATAGFPSRRNRFALAYFDFERLIRENGSLPQLSLQSLIPFRAVAWAASMDDAPRSEYRAIIQDTPHPLLEALQSLKPSPSTPVVEHLGTDPIAALTIDAGAVARLLSQLDAADIFHESFLPVILGTTTRIGIALRPAPASEHRLLPLPEVVVVLNSTQPEATQRALLQQVETILSGPAASIDLPPYWMEKQVDSHTVRYLRSYLGVGIYVTTVENLVIVASSEQALRSSAATSPGFYLGLKPDLSRLLSSDPTIVAVYLNNQAAGVFLNDVRGMLQFFAPTPQGGDPTLPVEIIRELESHGVFVAALRSEATSLSLTTAFSPVPSPPSSQTPPETAPVEREG
ncbi:MAG: hypothetical protein KDD44_03355 [Bdellovibrionales bacterium]|nr:hypothetical protein [Bdellovibrionales bacterium]